jgi:hypothetical protein
VNFQVLETTNVIVRIVLQRRKRFLLPASVWFTEKAYPWVTSLEKSDLIWITLRESVTQDKKFRHQRLPLWKRFSQCEGIKCRWDLNKNEWSSLFILSSELFVFSQERLAESPLDFSGDEKQRSKNPSSKSHFLRTSLIILQFPLTLIFKRMMATTF